MHQPAADSTAPKDPPSRRLTRRCILGLLGAAGASLLAPPVMETVTLALGRLDLDEWSARLSSPPAAPALPGAQNYTAFLQALELRNIAVPRIIASHSKQRQGVRNSLPPPELWKHLVSPLRVADALARRLQEDVIEVISAYRSPEYNAMCPGAAKNSWHVKNAALDLVFRSKPSDVAKAARDLRAQGLFRGGVGLYSSFTHIDTRGYNADW